MITIQTDDLKPFGKNQPFSKLAIGALLAFALLFLGACGVQPSKVEQEAAPDRVVNEVVSENEEVDEPEDPTPAISSDETPKASSFDLAQIPAYAGEPSVVINGDEPFFENSDLSREVFEDYAPLDSLGRCGVAFALIGKELMPTEEREYIGMIKPTGWQTPISKYDFVDGRYLYNRCHLIAFQLAGENGNERNLITGTRTMNTKGMLPLEEKVDDYVETTGNHVLLRVTPCFEGDNLLASGVLMEALSIEDGGTGVRFCRYAYNAEPGVVIDYKTGANWAEGEDTNAKPEQNSQTETEMTYVLNKRSHKFHYPDRKDVSTTSEANKQVITAKRSDIVVQGYDPCGMCQP